MSYAEDRADAAATFGEDGMVFTLTYPANATYDPATSTTSGTPPANQEVAGAIFPLLPFRKSGGTNIVEGDQQLMLSALNVGGAVISEPKVNGTVTAGSKTWTIIAVDPLSPANIDIFYDCVVRRSAG